MRKRSESGFTMVEVVTALALLALGVVPMMALLVFSHGARTESETRYRLHFLVANQLESLLVEGTASDLIARYPGGRGVFTPAEGELRGLPVSDVEGAFEISPILGSPSSHLLDVSLEYLDARAVLRRESVSTILTLASGASLE